VEIEKRGVMKEILTEESFRIGFQGMNY